MLDRVGTWTFGQGLVNEYSRIQTRMLTAQQQISTGKVGDQFADVKDKAGVLASAKLKSAAIESYSATTKEVLNKLDIQDLHLQQLSDIAGRLRAAIGDAISTGHAPAMMEEVKNLYNETVSILNARIDGKYVYGGSRTDQPPVNTPDLASLVGVPTVFDAFDNTAVKQTQRIDENEVIETGMLASDIGLGLMQTFKDIGTFDASANGPFGFTSTAAQTTFLIAEHASMPAVQADVNTYAAINGSRHAQVTAARDRHESMSAYFTKFIGDIEDVDLSEAVARLNQDQVAAQAAGRMIAQISQMSLLDFMS